MYKSIIIAILFLFLHYPFFGQLIEKKPIFDNSTVINNLNNGLYNYGNKGRPYNVYDLTTLNNYKFLADGSFFYFNQNTVMRFDKKGKMLWKNEFQEDKKFEILETKIVFTGKTKGEISSEGKLINEEFSNDLDNALNNPRNQILNLKNKNKVYYEINTRSSRYIIITDSTNNVIRKLESEYFDTINASAYNDNLIADENSNLYHLSRKKTQKISSEGILVKSYDYALGNVYNNTEDVVLLDNNKGIIILNNAVFKKNNNDLYESQANLYKITFDDNFIQLENKTRIETSWNTAFMVKGEKTFSISDLAVTYSKSGEKLFDWISQKLPLLYQNDLYIKDNFLLQFGSQNKYLINPNHNYVIQKANIGSHFIVTNSTLNKITILDSNLNLKWSVNVYYTIDVLFKNKEGDLYFKDSEKNLLKIKGDYSRIIWKLPFNSDYITPRFIHKDNLLFASIGFSDNILIIDDSTGKLINNIPIKHTNLFELSNGNILYYSPWSYGFKATDEIAVGLLKPNGVLIWKRKSNNLSILKIQEGFLVTDSDGKYLVNFNGDVEPYLIPNNYYEGKIYDSNENKSTPWPWYDPKNLDSYMFLGQNKFNLMLKNDSLKVINYNKIFNMEWELNIKLPEKWNVRTEITQIHSSHTSNTITILLHLDSLIKTSFDSKSNTRIGEYATKLQTIKLCADSLNFPKITTQGSTTFCEGEKVTFSTEKLPNYEYNWQVNNQDFKTNSPNNIEVKSSGKYSLSVNYKL